MKLSADAKFGFRAEPFVALVEQRDEDGAHIVRHLGATSPRPIRLYTKATVSALRTDEVHLSDGLEYLAEGDMVRLNPVLGKARVLYRRTSAYNTLFLTERCNSRCLMCSQPPRYQDDSFLADDIILMLPWMAKETVELGITGGEPTLLHAKLLEILQTAKKYLPNTALHMLSNGRLLSYLKYAERISAIEHRDLVIGIPLYADTSASHDFVVQAKGAFEQTIFGILNLGRVGLRVELRIVIHQATFARLSQFARFVARNLPFVHQVVFMGLELMGYARSNLEALWMDPIDYQEELEEAVAILDDHGVQVFIYNHQLCLLRPAVRRFAKKSISDWKNIYLPQCDACALKADCGGFFSSASLRHSNHIQPFVPTTV